MKALEHEARDNNLEAIFAFTYAPGFFNKLGFTEVERGELPLKAWKDCLRCPKFQNCDEIAVLKRIRDRSGPGIQDPEDLGPNSSFRRLVQLPKIAKITYF